MKQNKKVSMLIGLVLIIGSVVLLTGCPQKTSDKKASTSNVDEKKDNGKEEVKKSFAPFTGSNDQCLWKDSERAYYFYVSEGKIYDIKFTSDNKVEKAVEVGKVTDGKVVYSEDGTTVTQIAKIDGDELILGKGKGKETYERVKDIILVKAVKKALSE